MSRATGESGWPPEVERVAAFLQEAHAEARLEELSLDGGTATEAAAAIGCPLGAIAKSMLLVCDGDPVLVVIPGDRRVDTEKVARLVGVSSASVARHHDVVAATGFSPGAVSPFGLPELREVIVDRRLLEQSLVWASGGSERHMVVLGARELARLAHARVEDASLEQASSREPTTSPEG